MITARHTWQLFGTWALLLLSVIAATVVSDAVFQHDSKAHADVRITTPREPFKSGGARSEIVLRQILATLNRIDTRLERLETAVMAATKQEP